MAATSYSPLLIHYQSFRITANCVLYHVLSICLIVNAFWLRSAFAFHSPSASVAFRRAQQHRRHTSSADDLSTITTIIDVAYIAADTTTNHEGYFHDMSRLVSINSFSKMTGVQLALSTLPITTTASSATWTAESLALLQRADIVCFTNPTDIQSYLNKLDGHMGIPKDMKEEDRRKLPNKPTTPEEDTNSTTIMMAACPNYTTARECLQSGRWMSNHIYYPKSEEKMNVGNNDANNSGEREETDSIDVEALVNSVVQAAGDVMERKFWGGGW